MDEVAHPVQGPVVHQQVVHQQLHGEGREMLGGAAEGQGAPPAASAPEGTPRGTRLAKSRTLSQDTKERAPECIGPRGTIVPRKPSP